MEENQFMDKLKTGFPKKQSAINGLTAKIHIYDYNKTYILSGKNGLIEKELHVDHCDISLSSESLNYCFEQLWGGDTMNVNARFQIPRKGNFGNFRIFGVIGSALNHQEEFPVSMISHKSKVLIKKVLSKIK